MEAALAALSFFPLREPVQQVRPFGHGHINDTFLVRTTKQNWLLQAVNITVFQQPEIIERHLKILLPHDPSLFVPHLLSKQGTYHVTAQGKTWRLQQFMESAYAPEVCNDKQREEVVRGIARFTKSMQSLSLSDFQPTIPGFHDLSARLAQYEEAKKRDTHHRLKDVKFMAGKLDKWMGLEDQFKEWVRKGLPLRICHNDAKAANVLLNQSDHSFARVIDLDTVGPGYVIFDFGDLLRSMLPDVKENVADAHVKIDGKKAEQMQSLFIQECGDSLTSVEKDALMFGGLYMTYLMALRFFTDYLKGDVYYNVNYATENLDRAGNQCAVLEAMLNSYQK